MQPSSFSIKTIHLSDSDINLATNTLLTGLAATYFVVTTLGAPLATALGVAAICMVANVALAKLNDEPRPTTWYPVNKQSYYDFKTSVVHDTTKVYPYHFFLGVTLKLCGVRSPFAAEFRNSLTSPGRAIYKFGTACVVEPLVEETLFRGFLQEKIRDLQVYFFGKDVADSETHREIRVLTQATLSTCAYINPKFGVFNLTNIPFQFRFSYLAGHQKEASHNLWGGVAINMTGSSARCARVVLFGA